MAQLHLENIELEKIGFVKHISDKDDMNHEREYFKIDTINGCFYYNPKQDIYTWYHKTVVGNNANDVLLNITHRAELFTVLSCFNVDYNLILN